VRSGSGNACRDAIHEGAQVGAAAVHALAYVQAVGDAQVRAVVSVSIMMPRTPVGRRRADSSRIPGSSSPRAGASQHVTPRSLLKNRLEVCQVGSILCRNAAMLIGLKRLAAP